MTIKIFVTGTDTEVGKTYVSVGLLKLLASQGFSTLGIKPLASGCEQKDGELYNEDAMQLHSASSIKLDYQAINPLTFIPPVAPHIPAEQQGMPLSTQLVNEKCITAMQYPADATIVEGIGGWLMPLSYNETMADFVVANQLPVVLVVGLRLGCLNHTLLTYQAIQQAGVSMLGWVANCMEPDMLAQQENISMLKAWITQPCLGIINYQQRPEDALSISDIVY